MAGPRRCALPRALGGLRGIETIRLRASDRGDRNRAATPLTSAQAPIARIVSNPENSIGPHQRRTLF